MPEFILGLSLGWLIPVWIVLIAIFGIALFNKNGWVATIFMALFIYVVWNSQFNFIASAWENKWVFAKYIGIYLVIGFVVAGLEWYKGLKKKYHAYAKKREQHLANFLRVKGHTKLTDDLVPEFREYMADATYHDDRININKVNIKYSDLTFATLAWPIVVVHFLFADFFSWLCRKVFGMFGGMFLRIQKHVFRKFPELFN